MNMMKLTEYYLKFGGRPEIYSRKKEDNDVIDYEEDEEIDAVTNFDCDLNVNTVTAS